MGGDTAEELPVLLRDLHDVLVDAQVCVWFDVSAT